MKSRKRVSNDELLKDPVLSGDMIPDSDGLFSLGSAQKRLKNIYAGTLNVIATLTQFASIALTNSSNQIVFGTGTTTTLSAPSPAASQTVVVPDSGQTSTNVILQDNGSPQAINSNLNIANNVSITPTSTFMKNGLFQVQPDGSSKSVIQVLGWGPGANAHEFRASNIASFGACAAPAQFLSDDIAGDTVVASMANNTVYPSAAIRMGFAGSATAFTLSRSAITLNPPVVGNLGSITVTGTASVSLALRSFLLGFVTNAATFLSDTQASDIVLRNGVSNASLRIGFGTGSVSSVVVNSTALTSNVPVAAPSISISGDNNVFTFSNNTANSSKTQRFLTYDYTGSNQWAFLIPYCPFAGSNRLLIGGGSTVANAATSVDFYAGPNTTTLTGTKIVSITTSGLNVASGALSVSQSLNQLQLNNTILNCPATGSRTLTFADPYQNANVLTNSIVCGLTNASNRPSISAGSTPQPYEIRSFSTTSLSNDDAFLRLRAGGSFSTSSASWIDISGSSTIPDMNRNIVFGTGGTEILRITSSGASLTNGTLTLPETTGTLTWTHSVASGSFTTSYTYVTYGNLVVLTIGNYTTGTSFASAGLLQTTLPAAIRPAGSKAVICYNAVLTIGSTATPVRTDILFTGQMAFYGGIQSSGNPIPLGQTITWAGEQTFVYRLA